MSPDHLFICRHGKDESSPEGWVLSEEGRQQATRLGGQIAEITQGEDTEIFTSTRQRAVQTAEIIANILHISFQEAEALCSNAGKDVDMTLEIITKSKKSSLILITHEPSTKVLPEEYSRRQLKKIFTYAKLDCGQAWHIFSRTKIGSLLK